MRKYEDIMEDLGVFVFERKKKEMFGDILKEKDELLRKIECLKQQLLDNSITPNESYEHDPNITKANKSATKSNNPSKLDHSLTKSTNRFYEAKKEYKYVKPVQ